MISATNSTSSLMSLYYTMYSQDPTLMDVVNINSLSTMLQPLESATSDPSGSNSSTATASTDALSSVWNSLNLLNTQATPFLTTDDSNVFNQMTTTSSDSSNVTATTSPGATLASYSVGVSQLADTQETTGSTLSANGTTLSNGLGAPTTYTFNISTNGGSTTPIALTVNPGDTNCTVMQNMADAINAASNSGVSAQVLSSQDAFGNLKSTMLLDATNTGTDNGFTITDASGNLAAIAGLGNSPTIAAQDASLTVDGVAMDSQSNNVAIDDGNVTLNLYGQTSKNASVSVTADTSGITDQVQSFIQQYNSTIQSLSQNSPYIDPNISDDLTSFASENSFDLQNIGITVNSDNTLTLDQNTFQSSLSTDPTDTMNLISGPAGLIANAGSVAQNAVTEPLEALSSGVSLTSPDGSSVGLFSSVSPSLQYQMNNSLLNMSFNTSGSFYDTYV